MQLKKYNFNYDRNKSGKILDVLDDKGKPQLQALADDEDVDQHLGESRGTTSPSEVLHELTCQEMDAHPTLSYRDAFSRVQDKNPRLISLYASEVNGTIRIAS